MAAIERVLSTFLATPYRPEDLDIESPPFLDSNGLVAFSPNDIENPRNWSAARRWCLTMFAITIVVNAALASSAPTAVLRSIEEELHVSHEAAGLVVTMFLLGYAFGPLFWAPLSEFWGRRYIFVGTFLAYIGSTFLCAFTPNFAGLLVGRFLGGSFTAAAQSNAPGVLSDLWPPIERGTAMALFSVTSFVGPSLGPVISGFLQLTENFRWCFYVLLVVAGLSLFPLFMLPETLPAQVLTKKARRIRRARISGYHNVQSPAEASGLSLREIFKVALMRPWIILFDPISFFVALYITTAYMLLYMLYTIYPIVFQEKRGWNPGVGELPLLGAIVGAVIAGMICLYDSHLSRKRMLAGVEGRAEDRLYTAMVGAILFPTMMFTFGWTAEYNSIHWIVPTIAGTFLATSLVLIFVAYLNYLTDSYLQYTASAMAANTVCRSAFGASTPLFTEYMFKSLGIGGGGSLIGGFGCLLVPIPFIFYKYGEPIRKRSRFAPISRPHQVDAESDDNSARSHVSRPSSMKENADIAEIAEHNQGDEKSHV